MKRETAPTFGAWFREELKRSGKTQREVAAECGVHKVTLSRIINGENLSKEMAVKLAECLHADPTTALERWAGIGAGKPDDELTRWLYIVPPDKRPLAIALFRTACEQLSRPAA